MIKAREISQEQLTAECWLVQFNGLEACKECKVRGSKECGGQAIRKRLKNEKGFSVPLGKEI